MSSLPGYTLEKYVAWNYDLIVDGDGSANMSLMLAEALRGVPSRREITSEKFATLIKVFEPYRESVENWLSDFDDETQSWRDYAYYSPVPKDVFEKGGEILNERI